MTDFDYRGLASTILDRAAESTYVGITVGDVLHPRGVGPDRRVEPDLLCGLDGANSVNSIARSEVQLEIDGQLGLPDAADVIAQDGDASIPLHAAAGGSAERYRDGYRAAV